MNDSTRRDAPLNLLLMDKEEMVVNIKIKDSFGYRKHENEAVEKRERNKLQNYNP